MDNFSSARLTRWYWPKASPATYTWATLFGWFLVICAAFYLSLAVVGYLRTPTAELTMIAVWIAGGLLNLGTGLAVLKRKKIAVKLVWWWVILIGLGVIGTGFPPLLIFVWVAFMWVAKWFSTKRPLLA